MNTPILEPSTLHRPLALVLAVVALVGLVACGPQANDGNAADAGEETTEVTTETAETTAPAPDFSYEGATGPASWGDLRPEWSLCATGTEQSPIDIVDPADTDLPDPQAAWNESPLAVTHKGLTIQVDFPEGGTTTVGDNSWNLVQVHFHAPSEHTVAGQQYPADAHFVHADDEGNLAVLGVFFEEGAASEAWGPILANVPTTAGETITVDGTMIDPATLLPADLTYVRYDGSLTTPPCSEGVAWHVVLDPIELSSEQIATLTAVIDNTNRPVQPVNDREPRRDAS